MQRTLLLIMAVLPLGLAGCSSAGSGLPPPSISAAPAEPAAPPIPTGAALGGVLGGPIGASLGDSDRQTAWEAQVAALDSGQRRSWRGSHGVFGYVEPGGAAGDGCRDYSQTIYIAGRPNRGHGVGCKQPDGNWKMTS
jgi:surface antigen